MAMNALQKALVEAGLAEEPKERAKRHRQFKCHKCGTPMVHVPDTNTMACSQCKQYFLFSKMEG